MEKLSVPGTAIELFSPNEVEKFDMVAADLATIHRRLDGLTIASQPQALGVHNGLAEVKRLRETVESTRKAQVGPLNEQVKAINNAWRAVTEVLDKLEQTAKRKLLAWQQAERERIAREQEAARKRQEEAARREQEALRRAEEAKNSRSREKALAEAQKAGQELMAARVEEPMDAPTGIKTDSGTTWTRPVWTFKVADPQLVPREFLCVDEKAIRAAIAKGVRDIAGVTIWQDEQLATRVG